MKRSPHRLIWLAAALAIAIGGCAKDVNIVGGPYVRPDGVDRVIVTWETELPGNSWVDYGLTDGYGVRIGSDAETRTHRVPLPDLRPGRRYFYRVSSAGSQRTGTFTSGTAFTKGPYAQNVTPSSIVIMWEASPAVGGAVVFGPTGAIADTAKADDAAAFQEVTLSGLNPGTTYRYRALAGGLSSAAGTFRTPADADTAFRFILYGDSRSHPEVHGKLAGRMAQEDVAFVIHSGDFVDDGRKAVQWGPQFFTPVQPLALRTPIFPAIGNHEKDAPAYYRYFSVPANGSESRPEAWYAFDYGNAHFTVLDTNPPSGRFAAGSEQLRWLEQDLATSDAQWKLVVFHHPIYSSGRYSSDMELRSVLDPLFERYAVDMVLTGHDHLYERTRPLRGGKRHDDGVVHVVSGGGGADLYPAGRSPWTAVSKSCTHFCAIEISGSRLDMEATDSDGRQVDLLTIHKQRDVLDGWLQTARESDGRARRSVIVELGRTGRLEAAAPIAAHAQTQEVGLRRAVAEGLARIADPRQTSALAALSEDDDTEVRRWATRGLIDVGGRDAARTCLVRLQDSDRQVRRTAAEGLRRNPMRRAVPLLVVAARDEDKGVRLAAVQALAVTPGRAAEDGLLAALKDAERQVWRTAFAGVIEQKLQARAVPDLIGLLPREEGETLREIIRSLGDTRDRTALPALLELVRDESAGTRQAAVVALAKLKDRSAVPALIAALDDTNRGVRRVAVRALTAITGEFPGSTPDDWKRWWRERGRRALP
ncbi:MAG: HEAT repeat domain-containing protein [Candidatus Latescibacteria bacterium]|nr:HEAT repeat domain-containing protein [Candidatus Latescibacterota bacterium]